MSGLGLGLAYQVVVAIGFVWVAGVARNANPFLKANVMLAIAGVIASVVLVVFGVSRRAEFAEIAPADLAQLSLGAVLVLVLGESIYIAGLSASNATTMAYTALAFPAICLALDVALRRIPISSLTVTDYAGMVFLVMGFMLLSLREVS